MIRRITIDDGRLLDELGRSHRCASAPRREIEDSRPDLCELDFASTIQLDELLADLGSVRTNPMGSGSHRLMPG